MKIKKPSRKKAQQEIVGFVLIVVIMVVIGIVFLGMSLRKNKNIGISTEDAEIANFLSASQKYTTNCVLEEPFYAEIKDVIRGCYSNSQCSEDGSACETLNHTYTDMLEKVWSVGSDRPVKYAKITFYYQQDSDDESSKNVFLKIETGNQTEYTSKRAGRSMISAYPGNIVIQLEIYK